FEDFRKESLLQVLGIETSATEHDPASWDLRQNEECSRGPDFTVSPLGLIGVVHERTSFSVNLLAEHLAFHPEPPTKKAGQFVVLFAHIFVAQQERLRAEDVVLVGLKKEDMGQPGTL